MQQQNQIPIDLFKNVQQQPPLEIFQLTDDFLDDPNPKKINLLSGTYRGENGNPFVFDIIRKVEQEMLTDETVNKEYLPTEGIQDFILESQKFIFGSDSQTIKDKRIATIQTPACGVAITMAMDFIKKYLQLGIMVSDPCYHSYIESAIEAGLNVQKYRYFDNQTRGLDFDGLIQDLNSAKPKTIILLQVCGHNPTGIDPTQEQWQKIAECLKNKQLIPFFDISYQGFSDPDFIQGAYPIRLFNDMGFQMFIGQSFSKCFGIYGERLGAIHMVCQSQETAIRVQSQFKQQIEISCGSSPDFGCLLVLRILKNPEYKKQWLQELQSCYKRITDIRNSLKEKLIQANVPGNWDLITKQTGMFAYLGITKEQCEHLAKKFSVYILKNSRINLPSINKNNIDYFVQSISQVLQPQTEGDFVFGNFESQVIPYIELDAQMFGFQKDTNPNKINLLIGQFRGDQGQPYTMNIVKKVELELAQDPTMIKDYQGQLGNLTFVKLAQQLVFGQECPQLQEEKIASSQSISCAGAMRLIFDYIKWQNLSNEILISQQNWDAFICQIPQAGLNYKTYPYYDKQNKKILIEEMIATFKKAKPGTFVLLQVCAHNPTGFDPTKEQWIQIAKVCAEHQLVPIFDFAYQGFADDLYTDRQSIQIFLQMGFSCFVGQSFSKNMGLYGERCGCVHFVCKSKQYAQQVRANLKVLISSQYRSPPQHGANIVTRILSNEQYKKEWEDELKNVVLKRITDLKQTLRNLIEQDNIPGDWEVITLQKGMYIYLNLKQEVVDKLIKQYGIYLLNNGRINICGLNNQNIKYFVQSLKLSIQSTEQQQQ